MSTRQYRRYLRDSKTLSKDAEHVNSEEEQREEIYFYRSNTNAFQLLNTENTEEEDIGEEEDSSGALKSSIRNYSSLKKKNKKNRKKNSKMNQINVENITSEQEADSFSNEVDHALQALGIMNLSEKASSHSDSSMKSLSLPLTLLSIETRMLDSEAELKRKFGSSVATCLVNEYDGERTVHNRRPGKTGPQRYRHIARRTPFLFAKPKDAWPMMIDTRAMTASQWLSMSVIEEVDRASSSILNRNCSTVEFRLHHGLVYEEVQIEFYDNVKSYQPQLLADILYRHPYHIDCLLQLSHVCQQGGDYSLASDLVERALYSVERILHPRFNIASGICRMSYQIMENRGFFLALFRHILMLHRIGCWRTAFEVCKTILAMDPDSDPLGIIYFIDFYALQSEEYDFYLRYVEEMVKPKEERLTKKKSTSGSKPIFPSHLYSVALAQYKQKQRHGEKTTTNPIHTLIKAIQHYPLVLKLLYEKNRWGGMKEASILAIENWANVSSLSDENHLCVRLYVECSKSLWKDPEVVQWVSSVIDGLVEGMYPPIKIISSTPLGYLENAYRHIIICGYDNLLAYLPIEIKADPTAMFMFDPIPPKNNIIPSKYQSYFIHNPTNRTFHYNNSFSAFLRSLAPWNIPTPANTELPIESLSTGNGRTLGLDNLLLQFLPDFAQRIVVQNQENADSNQSSFSLDDDENEDENETNNPDQD